MPVSPVTPSPSREPVRVRPMLEADLDEADRVMRLAFGTFLGLPDPARYMGDANYVRPRWLANPSGALVAGEGGGIVGSAFVTHWGTVGFFGPLTVRPDRWDGGVAKALLVAVEDRFAEQGTRLCGLNTFPGSPKHLGLYQKFGYLPGALIPTLARPIPHDALGPHASLFSEEPKGGAESLLTECREMTDAVYEGLDLRDEIQSIAHHDFGDTVFLREGSRLEGLAACHIGPGTEAGGGTCYVKFGAVRPGPEAARSFEALVDACAALGARRGAHRLVAGVNAARRGACSALLRMGFRMERVGVSMVRPDVAGYNGPSHYVMDDWQ